jgi:hypothetical protein
MPFELQHEVPMNRFNLSVPIGAMAFLAIASTSQAASLECTNWQSNHPDWLWCDDFESDSAIEQNYFDVQRVDGRLAVTAETAFGGSSSLKGTYAPGVAEAGSIKLSFGSTPVSPKRYTSTNFDDVYWRFYMKLSANWTGNAIKLTRATIFAGSNWSQAAIGHLWEDAASSLGLGLDPASGVSGSQVVTTQYNDFDNLRWLGKTNGTTQVYDSAHRDKWMCIEVHMKLNTLGQSDGEMAFWVDGHVEAQKTGLNFRGSYGSYGINAIMLENYTNSGAPQTQSRYFDNFVVSKNRIGCVADVRPNPPTDLRSN